MPVRYGIGFKASVAPFTQFFVPPPHQDEGLDGLGASCYCRFHVTFQRAVPKFVANLPITFPSSKIGRELRDKVRKYISMFELL
jgi:hypothetical protein